MKIGGWLHCARAGTSFSSHVSAKSLVQGPESKFKQHWHGYRAEKGRLAGKEEGEKGSKVPCMDGAHCEDLD